MYHNNSFIQRHPKILAVAGGKGGIGKSFFSANLGMALYRMDYRVYLVNMDIGAANLHTWLGISAPKTSLFQYFNGEIPKIEDIAIPTFGDNLRLIAGGQEFWQQMKPQNSQKIQMISQLQKLDADYVIIDLGAGTHVNTLDFFIFSHAGILVVVPEPTSIENSYIFLKSMLYRKVQSLLKSVDPEEEFNDILEGLLDPKIHLPPIQFIEQSYSRNPEKMQKILQLIRSTRLGVLMNQVRTKTDVDLGHSMAQISKQYFGFDSQLIGAVAYDDLVWKSIRNRKPINLEQPETDTSKYVTRIAKGIADKFLPTQSVTRRLDAIS